MAAFDLKTGIISPGGVGYDINCLTGDSRVLTELGYFRPIKDFKIKTTEIGSNSHIKLSAMKTEALLVSLNSASMKTEPKKPVVFIKKEKQKTRRIKTENGFSLKATPDHPFLTRLGMVPLEKLGAGEDIAVFPFEGVEYEQEQGIILRGLTLGKNVKRELEKRNLLPLKYDDNAARLTKIFGYLIGDGVIYTSRGKGYIYAYGSQEDLELMKEDFNKLGFSARIYSRERDHKIKDQYGIKMFSSETCELHVSSKSLAELFFALGYPKGSKTIADYRVPEWIKEGPVWIKRLFLAGFFGAEMSTPSTHTKTGFYSPVLSQNKNASHIKSGRRFMTDIMLLLEGLGVGVSKISTRNEHKNENGETCRIRLLVSAEENNLLRLWRQIGFEYNIKRQKASEAAVMYILRKKRLTAERKVISDKVKEYKKKGLSLRECQELLEMPNANKRFIERAYYENAGQRLRLDFVSFKDFLKSCEADWKTHGCLFDRIESIRDAGTDDVYDFTVEDNHNFVANSLIVSNCGVRLIKTNLTEKDVSKRTVELLNSTFANVPSGLGSKGKIRLSLDELKEVLEKGAEWAVQNGYGWKHDLERLEEDGRLKNADSSKVSETSLRRGMPQLGSLGSGNHFLEIQVVDQVYDDGRAKAWGLEKGMVTVMVHCGSRGLGHQVASDYIRKMEHKYGYEDLPDRELINAPFQSELGQEYYKAMSAAANYAWANRQAITHWVRESFSRVLGKTAKDMDMQIVYDVAHNIAKVEKHEVDGETRELVIHRKGATRSFGPGRPELADLYRKTGQPVIIPGSMGSASYVLVGTDKALEVSWGSTAHGAGRVMSRHAALRKFRGEKVKRELEQKGVTLRAASWKGIAEEAPGVYKDIDEVVRVSHDAGIGNLVVKVRPIGVIKG